MIPIGKNTRSTIISKGISAGKSNNSYRGLVKVLPGAEGARNYTQCDSMLIGGRSGANTFPYLEGMKTTARHLAEGRGLAHHKRLLQGRVQRVADGVRRRGAAPPRHEA